MSCSHIFVILGTVVQTLAAVKTLISTTTRVPATHVYNTTVHYHTHHTTFVVGHLEED